MSGKVFTPCRRVGSRNLVGTSHPFPPGITGADATINSNMYHGAHRVNRDTPVAQVKQHFAFANELMCVSTNCKHAVEELRKISDYAGTSTSGTTSVDIHKLNHSSTCVHACPKVLVLSCWLCFRNPLPDSSTKYRMHMLHMTTRPDLQLTFCQETGYPKCSHSW